MNSLRMISAPIILLSSLNPSPCRAEGDKKDVPDDFKVFAQYFPGYSIWKPWKATITASGEVTQGLLNDKVEWESKRLRPITRQAMAEIVKKVKEGDFFELKERYTKPVTDCPTLVLVITIDGRTKKVSVYDPEDQDQAELRHFLKIWDEVLRKAPPPNPEQRPRP